MALLDENNVSAKLDALLACLCAQIAEEGLPATCACVLFPGDTPSLDYIDDCDDETCGTAWVRLVIATPTTGIGVVSDTVNNCGAEVGFQVEVGIVRCLSAGDTEGNPPTPDELTAATHLQVADMLTIRKALLCCDLGDVILDTYEPFGPQGMAVGGFWLATLSETPVEV